MAAKKTSKEKEHSLESSLRRLQEIVETLEQGSISLDDAMVLYEEGVGISKECGERLKSAELRIKKLSKDIDGQFAMTEFDEEK